MAASRLPAPGTMLGPCAEEGCGHIDCNATRADAAKVCRFCQKPIGYETEYFADPLGQEQREDMPTMASCLVHAACLEEAAEAQRRYAR